MDGVRLRGGRGRGDRVRRYRQRTRRRGAPAIRRWKRRRRRSTAPRPRACWSRARGSSFRRPTRARSSRSSTSRRGASWSTPPASRRWKPRRARSGSPTERPSEVKAAVRKTVKAAALLHTVPVLVAYNIPFRDCAQYSAGGAVDTAAYEAWIDGFAAGIGSAQVVVILEPDGLGIIPNNDSDVWRSPPEWCTADAGPGANPDERYAQINYAVDSIHAEGAERARLPRRHAQRLAGRERGRVSPGARRRRRAREGFFLNVSNYQIDADNPKYGTWISSCLALSTATRPAVRPGGCVVGLPEPVRGDAARVSGNWIPNFTPGERRRRRRAPYAERSRGSRLDRAVHAVDALRDRHQPQRPGAARRHAVRRRALQPAGGRAERAPRAATGATRPAPAWACARRRTPASRCSTPTSGSRCRASRTARATSPAARGRGTSPPTTPGASPPPPRTTSTRCGAWSIRPRAPGSRSRRSSSRRTRRRRCSEPFVVAGLDPRPRSLRRPRARYTRALCRRRSA